MRLSSTLLLALPCFATAQTTFDLIGGGADAELLPEPECESRGGAGCSSDRFCDSDLTCSLKRNDGEACNADFKCLSERCRGNVCDPIEVLDVDPCAGVRCSGKSFCEQGTCVSVNRLPNGEECESNAQCESGFCDQFVFEGSELQVQPMNSNTNNPSLCQPKKESGDGCNENFECISNLCKDFECTSGNSKPSCSKDNECGNGQFCNKFVFENSNTNNPSLCEDKKPNGEGCNGNNECLSNNCNDFECAAADNSLLPVDSCSKDKDCDDDEFCNRSVFEDSNTNNPSLCEERRPNGEGCNGDNECRSNNCDDFECAAADNNVLPVDSCSNDRDCEDDEFCNRSVFENSNTNNPSLCQEKKPNGEGCNGDNQCRSNNCDDFECAAADNNVLPVESCSNDRDCEDDEFCNRSVFEDSNTNNPSLCQEKRPNGEGCNGDNECRSNNCDDFECAAADNTVLPVESCSNDRDCEDDEFCNRSVFEDSNTNNPSLCEGKRTNGEGCNGNNECISNTCDDFECTAPGSDLLSIGEKCKDASECQHGLYCDKKCKLLVELGSRCKKDIECVSGSCFDKKTCVPVEGEAGDFCIENSHCASDRCEGRKDSKTCSTMQVSRSNSGSAKDPPAKKTSAPKTTKTKKRTAGLSSPKKRKSNIRGTRHGDPSWFGGW